MSDGPKLYGVEYIPQKDLTFPFWEREFDYGGTTENRKTGQEALTSYDQTPTDRGAAKGRQYDRDAIIASALARATQSGPVKVRVSFLPDVLNSVVVSFNKTSGVAASDFPVSQQAYSAIVAGSGGFNIKSTAQASAAILPNVVWDIDRYSDIMVDGTEYVFYSGPTITLADVLTKLTMAAGATVNNVPRFKPKQHMLRLFGQQVSLQATAETDIAASFNSATPVQSSGSYKYGDSYSQEVGVQSHVETIPYTIHAGLTISSNTDTQTVTVTVKADTNATSGPGASAVPAVTNEPTPITMTANGSVKTISGSNTLAATSPTDIPKTGLYLVDVTFQEDDYGLSLIRATVVDFSQYA